MADRTRGAARVAQSRRLPAVSANDLPVNSELKARNGEHVTIKKELIPGQNHTPLPPYSGGEGQGEGG